MRAAALIGLTALALAGAGRADGFRILEGHGGPVMGVAAAGGEFATASFDNSVGLWRDGAPRWLEGHEAAVNTVAFVGPDRVVSAGDDMTAIVWDRDTGAALHRLEGHTGKIMSIDASPDGATIATAGWDRRVGLWDVGTGALIRWIDGYGGAVNDVAFDGPERLFSASYDGAVREWRVADGTLVRVLARHGFGVNRLLVSPAGGWLAYGALDGGTRVIDLATGAEIADLTLERRPILAMAMRADGGEIAVGDGEGYIMVVETAGWTIRRDFRAAKRGPIWALAYVDDGAALMAGGIESAAYIWPLAVEGERELMAGTTPEFHTAPGAVGNGERQFLRKCSVCHTLSPDGGRRAGPSLHGLFGRRAGSRDGYNYSEALLDASITWDEKTIDKLFALGPERYTPGSKMPMQRITSEQDRSDLVAYLKRATAPED